MCSGAIFGDVFHGEIKSGDRFRSNSGEKKSPEYILELLACRDQIYLRSMFRAISREKMSPDCVHTHNYTIIMYHC